MLSFLSHRFLGLSAFTALMAISSVSAFDAAAQSGISQRLGSNLTEVNDYSPQIPFIDHFLTSRAWFTQCDPASGGGCTNNNAWDTGEAASLDLDEHGWVRSLPLLSAPPVYTFAATFWDVPAEFPDGVYIVLYDGEGTIEYGLGAKKNISRSRAGRDVVHVDPANGGILLRLTSTDPNHTGNYVRNIKFVAAGDEALVDSKRFSDAFVSQLAPYEVLRFMDWMRTNNSSASSWNNRSKATDARFSSDRGVPAEIMVELANTSGKAPWFNMPHQADNTYIQSFATLVKQNLSTSLPVFVEYTNEAWNGVFSQGSWIESQGEAAWPSSNESPFTKRINFYGRRSAEVCDLWRGVFSDDPSRVVCVIASQAANSWTASEALACPLWNEAPCASHGIQALAIAPYMGDYIGGDTNYALVSKWSGTNGLNNLFKEMTAGAVVADGPQEGAMKQSFGWMVENKQVADQYNIKLVTYEGGQHLVGVGSASSDSSVTELFTSANRDSRMGSIYSDYLSGWAARGGSLFMHFNDISSYSQYGSWGALEKIGQPSTAKYDALYSYALGHLPPGSPRTSSRVRLTVRKSGSGHVTSSPRGIRCGSTCSVRVTRSTKLKLTATASRGYRFKSWSGACQTTHRTCRVTMSQSTKVRAIFARISR